MMHELRCGEASIAVARSLPEWKMETKESLIQGMRNDCIEMLRNPDDIVDVGIGSTVRSFFNSSDQVYRTESRTKLAVTSDTYLMGQSQRRLASIASPIADLDNPDCTVYIYNGRQEYLKITRNDARVLPVSKGIIYSLGGPFRPNVSRVLEPGEEEEWRRIVVSLCHKRQPGYDRGFDTSNKILFLRNDGMPGSGRSNCLKL